MAASTQRTLVILGSGPGLGSHIPALFAKKGFTQVALLSRNAERLATEVDFVKKASSGVNVKSFVVDVGNTESLKKTLKAVEDAFGSPEVVVYNAARLGVKHGVGEADEEHIIDDIRVCLNPLNSTILSLLFSLLFLLLHDLGMTVCFDYFWHRVLRYSFALMATKLLQNYFQELDHVTPWRYSFPLIRHTDHSLAINLQWS
jgi:NAD(P)-dependent dehydrogenase (short-subunit alcohol dehydrogenase family)